MKFYYSKTTNSFYNSEINESTPEDKVEITETQWQDLLQEQSNGKVISFDSKGNPIAIDIMWPNVPTIGL